MIKYEKFNYSDNDISNVISEDEKILFDLEPKKNLYFINRIINIIPIIIINLVFDHWYFNPSMLYFVIIKSCFVFVYI